MNRPGISDTWTWLANVKMVDINFRDSMFRGYLVHYVFRSVYKGS